MRKHSKYRPRAVISNPLTFLRPATAEEKRAVMLKFLTAIDCMVRGAHPGVEEWRALSDAVNTVETLALHFKKLDPHEVIPPVMAAIDGMVHASRRFKAGQGMRLDAKGLEGLRAVIDIYGQCLDGLTSREMAMATAETERRIKEVLARGNSTREVIAM